MLTNHIIDLLAKVSSNSVILGPDKAGSLRVHCNKFGHDKKNC